MTADHEAQIRDLLEEREELLTEIRRLRMGRHPAGRALRDVEAAMEAMPVHRMRVGWANCIEDMISANDLRAALTAIAADMEPCAEFGRHPRGGHADRAALAEALTERDAGHEGGGGA